MMWVCRLLLELEPKSKVEALPESLIAGQPTFEQRVAESIAVPIMRYFDAQTKQLVAIDYTDTQHMLSE